MISKVPKTDRTDLFIPLSEISTKNKFHFSFGKQKRVPSIFGHSLVEGSRCTVINTFSL